MLKGSETNNSQEIIIKTEVVRTESNENSEVSTNTTVKPTDDSNGPRIRLSGAQRRKLKKLRVSEYGECSTSAPRRNEPQTWYYQSTRSTRTYKNSRGPGVEPQKVDVDQCRAITDSELADIKYNNICKRSKGPYMGPLKTDEEGSAAVYNNSCKKLKGPDAGPQPEKDEPSMTQMAITHSELGANLTEDDADRIKFWILENIDEGYGGHVQPRFTNCSYKEGSLRITCADKSSQIWLADLMTQGAPWVGAKLQLVAVKDLPRPLFTVVSIPGTPLEEPEKILSRLQIQNRGLDTSKWRVVDRKQEPNGQELFILMDQNSWAVLGNWNHRPFINFSRGQFSLVDKSSSKSSDGEPSSSC